MMINGAPTDNNAKLFKQGALSVFNTSGVKIGKQFDTPDWSPDKAQTEMQQAITALGNNGFQGVYAANDGTAGGAIAAMKSAGIKPSTRPTTGQDAELAAIQRILAGQQYMTVYKAVKLEAPAAATIAVALANGQASRPRPPINGTTNNGIEERAVGDPHSGGGHQGQHQRHDRQGRVLDGGADLHGARTRPRARRRESHDPLTAPRLAGWREGATRRGAGEAHDRKGTDMNANGPSAAAEGGEQALRARAGAQRRRLRGASRRGGRAGRRQRRRQVHAGQDHRGHLLARRRRVLLRRPAGDDQRPQGGRRARDRDRLPGPRAVRQPRRGGQPVPRSGGDRRRRRRGHCGSSTRSTWSTARTSCSTSCR